MTKTKHPIPMGHSHVQLMGILEGEEIMTRLK